MEGNGRKERGRKSGRRVHYEKEGKAEEKGGHIVESRPGFLFVQSADKSLFVVITYLQRTPLLPCYATVF